MSSTDEIRRNPEKVHSELKAIEEGVDHPDTKTLRDYAQGLISKDD